MAELLVRVDRNAAEEVIDRLRRDYRVTQVAAPLAVVEAEDEGGLRQLPGVVAVAGPRELPADLTDGLSEDETLFADAWLQRAREDDSGERRGEGLDWDAPGYTPP